MTRFRLEIRYGKSLLSLLYYVVRTMSVFIHRSYKRYNINSINWNSLFVKSFIEFYSIAIAYIYIYIYIYIYGNLGWKGSK